MLFNSFTFLLLFLPLTLGLFYAARRWLSARISIALLVLASFLFYAYWNPAYLLLLLASIVVNYAFGRWLAVNNPSRVLLASGVTFNLSLLGYFKYSGFLIASVNDAFGLSFGATSVVLPLAISFFTFQQIAYLVDCYRHAAHERNFMNYCLFVSFFPQLIAGPIVHHKEVMPQINRMLSRIEFTPNFAAGLSLLIVGLFKKVVIADNFAVYASRFFNSANEGVLHAGDAWVGALSYHFQIYFDFSGYSDMAIGLGRLFGIVLPINFNSPYRSLSIIDFWRRWHMTLSRFLRDYLYFALGGNRKGPSRRYVNLLATMLLGGLWHGAAWTFVVWGGLHGSYLILNHWWRSLCDRMGIGGLRSNSLYKAFSLILTTLVVVIAWVYFRAPDLMMANNTVLAMFGVGEGGLSKSYGTYLVSAGFGSFVSLLWGAAASPLALTGVTFTAALLFTVYLPNSCQIFKLLDYEGACQWRPTLRWALIIGVLLACSLVGMFGASEFIYFQF
ncbi:MAG: MBOAT family protein [Proteobacteria bacterium]|nr:MBOAT family protein [Pseudomonadota bacterium]